MRLIGLSMVKNEGDIIEAYVRHNLRLLDALFIIDNDSVDGTREILVKLQREGLPVVIYDDPRAAYFQSAKMTALYRNVCEYTNPDFVFPLDADEFLCAESREALESQLAQLPRGCHGLIPWKTYLYPPTVAQEAAQHNPIQRMTHRRSVELPQYYKVIINADAAENHRLVVAQGNHSVSHADRGELLHVLVDGLAVAHFPIRGESQVMTKVTGGWLAYLAKDPNAATSDQGYQWRDLYQRLLANGGIVAEELHAISLTYAQLPAADGAEQRQSPVFDPLPVHYELRYQELWRPSAFEVMARTMERYLTAGAHLTSVSSNHSANGAGQILSSGAWEAEFHLEHLFLDLPPFRYMADKYQPRSVLDVGCGLGGYIRMFRAWGAGEARGVDGFSPSDAFLSPGDYVAHDLSTPLDLQSTYDLVICTEVIEHIDTRFEEVVLDTIAHHARGLILFSAAEPNQPGEGHVNCRPLSHWLERWQVRGWQPDPFESLALRSLSTFSWFRRNLVVLKRASQWQTPNANFTSEDLERLALVPAHWYNQASQICSFPLSEPLPPSLGKDIVMSTRSALAEEQDSAGDMQAQIAANSEELERLQAALVAREAHISQLEYAPPPTLIIRGLRQLVLPLESRRYRLYRRIRRGGRRAAPGKLTVGTASAD